MKSIWRILSDRRDERLARRWRVEMGRRGWLVSWRMDSPGEVWMARLSCGDWPDTVERFGPSRCHAIERAAQTLRATLAHVPMPREFTPSEFFDR